MMMHSPTAFARSEPVDALVRTHPRPAPAPAPLTLMQGSLVETATGWTEAGTLAAGDLVQTLDGGLTEIAGLRRHSPARGPGAIRIPGGALDNCSDLILSPGQSVALIDPACERLFGTSCILAPARALCGFRGIAPVAATTAPVLTELHFAREELVYTQTGTLLHAPAAAAAGHFRRLSYGETRALLMLMSRGTCGVDPTPAAARR